MTLEIIYDLKSETFKELNKTQWWIQSAVRNKSSNNLKSYLKKLDEICLRLERNRENKEVLLEDKILNFSKSSLRDYYPKDRDELVGLEELSNKEKSEHVNLLNFFGELKAIGWLYEEGFRKIKLIKRSKGKTPEVYAKKGKDKFSAEVKSVNFPKDGELDELEYISDKDYRQKKGCLDVDEDYKKGLKKKIKWDVENSVEKFRAVESRNNLVFLNLNELSFRTKDSFPRKKCLRQILGDSFFSTLERNNKVEIITISMGYLEGKEED